MKKLFIILFFISSLIQAQDLIYWFKADSLSGIEGSAVTQLTDYSGNGNHFNASANGILRLNRGLISGGAPSTHKAVEFSTSCFVRTALDSDVDDYTFIFAYKSNTDDLTVARYLFDNESTRLVLALNTSLDKSKYGIYQGSWTAVNNAFTTSDSLKIIAYKLSSAGSIFIDSVKQTTTFSYTQQAINSNMTIGESYIGTGASIKGDIFEARIYKGTMSDSEIRSVSWNLHQYYRDLLPPPVTDSLIIITPSDYTKLESGDSVYVSWIASRDSVLFADSLVVNDSCLFIAPDTSGVYSVIIKLAGDISIKDTINFLVYLEKYIKVIDVDDTGYSYVPLQISVETNNISEFNLYWTRDTTSTWNFIDVDTVTITGTVVDTTVWIGYLDKQAYGDLFIKAEEKRDTVAWIYTQKDFALSVSPAYLGSPLATKGCFIFEGYPWQPHYLSYPSCGWVSGLSAIEGIATSVRISTHLEVTTGYKSEITMPPVGDCSYLSSDMTILNGWKFSVTTVDDSTFIAVTDLIRMATRYFKVSELVARSPYSPSGMFKLTRPLSILSMNSLGMRIDTCFGGIVDTLVNNNQHALLFVGNAPNPAFYWDDETMSGTWKGWDGWGITTAYPVFYVMELADNFLFAPTDDSALIYDVYEMTTALINRRDYFRGIHPKIRKD